MVTQLKIAGCEELTLRACADTLTFASSSSSSGMMEVRAVQPAFSDWPRPPE